MLTGKSPFVGKHMVDTMHAVLNDRPPALTGSSAVDAVDRVIQRALEKTPRERYQTAHEMADGIRGAMVGSDVSGEMPVARAVTRLIVLPLRVLRSDPETDFMAFGLADALTTSLSGVDSLVVRSSLVASQFADTAPDLKKIATETNVDAVLTGTLLRAGDQIRVNCQLLEAPDGTVLWSQSVQSSLGDLFKLQDDFTQRIVESLKIPLSHREEQQLHRDVPATPRAYEFYLRGNQLAANRANWKVALDLYQQCVDEDPRFAPGWARLGRQQRLIGIYFDAEHVDEHLRRAEESFQRALALNPDLPLAHNLYAYLEVDRGRAKEGMLRLLDLARRQRADPDVLAGLVHVCRYCGLLAASVAAYEKAHRLDPNIQTSVCHSYWFLGDPERAVETDTGTPPFMKVLAQIRSGRSEQALDSLRALATGDGTTYSSGWGRLVAAMTGDREAFHQGLSGEVENLRDPEGIYYWALMSAMMGDLEMALDLLQVTVDRGWLCHEAMATEPMLDQLRSDPRLSRILREMETKQREVAAAFVAAGGDRLLGLKG